jgi:hypothetical protein
MLLLLQLLFLLNANCAIYSLGHFMLLTPAAAAATAVAVIENLSKPPLLLDMRHGRG